MLSQRPLATPPDLVRQISQETASPESSAHHSSPVILLVGSVCPLLGPHSPHHRTCSRNGVPVERIGSSGYESWRKWGDPLSHLSITHPAPYLDTLPILSFIHLSSTRSALWLCTPSPP